MPSRAWWEDRCNRRLRRRCEVAGVVCRASGVGVRSVQDGRANLKKVKTLPVFGPRPISRGSKPYRNWSETYFKKVKALLKLVRDLFQEAQNLTEIGPGPISRSQKPYRNWSGTYFQKVKALPKQVLNVFHEGQDPTKQVRDVFHECQNPTKQVRDVFHEGQNPTKQVRDVLQEGKASTEIIRLPSSSDDVAAGAGSSPTPDPRQATPTSDPRCPTTPSPDAPAAGSFSPAGRPVTPSESPAGRPGRRCRG